MEGARRDFRFVIGALVIFPLVLLLSIHSPLSAEDSYTSDVRELMETTYLGHASHFPDPDEPAIVLTKYLNQDPEEAVNQMVSNWVALTNEFPTSRYAQLGLAKAYEMAGQLEDALSTYLKASSIGVAHGRILHTHEIAQLCVTLGDKGQLDRAFGELLSVQQDKDPKNYCLALVDYADGLAKLGDYHNAFPIFDRAVLEYPERNSEAVNRYATISRMRVSGKNFLRS